MEPLPWSVPGIAERNGGLLLLQHPGASWDLGAKGTFHLLQLILHHVEQAASSFLQQALQQGCAHEPCAEEHEADAAATVA